MTNCRLINMEGVEKEKQPELKIEKLMVLLDTIKWEDGYEATFNGTVFCLHITPKEDLLGATEKELEDFGDPAEYHASTLTDGWDIYLWDTIPDARRKRTLFHEILEINLRDQEFSNQRAHEIALTEEEKVFGPRAHF